MNGKTKHAGASETGLGATRRGFNKILLGGALAAPAIIGRAEAQTLRAPDLTLILMGDLHSGYSYTAQLISSIKQTFARYPGTPGRILLNGDLFESGNVLSVRDSGLVDLAMIRSMAAMAPVIVNIGNHDADLVDLSQFVTQMTGAGATVITNVTDVRTGRLFAPASTSFAVQGGQVNVVGFGTTSLTSYASRMNGLISVPTPGTYAAQNLPTLQNGASLNIVMAHAGFAADTAILQSVSSPTLMHGAHDHLTFTQALGRNLHVHSGAWQASYVIVDVRFNRFGVTMTPTIVPVTRTMPADASIAALIAQERANYLTAQDLAVLGTMPQALALDQAVLFACDAVAKAAGVDVAMLSHTTFGDGLPAGPVTRFDFNAFIRFDGGFSGATIDGATLAAILPRTNQFGVNYPYAQRIGDYLYVNPVTPVAGKSYKIAAGSFAVGSSVNQLQYLGTTQIPFSAIPNLQLKAAVQAALPQ